MAARACGPWCSFCGGCSEAWEGRVTEDEEPTIYCPCGQLVDRVAVPVLLEGNQVVVCCSELCAADVQAKRGAA